MLERALDRVFRLLPLETRRKLFWPRNRITTISSTRPGELTSTPERRRIGRILAGFVAGETQELPETTIESDPHILDGGWLHPVIRLEKLEEKQGLPIVGLEWIDEALQGRPVAWCGPEMQGKGVKVLFSIPSED